MTAIAQEAATGLPELRAIYCVTHWRTTVGAHHGGGSLPAVRPGDVAVLGLPDPTWGEIVGAVLVPADPGRIPAVTELHDLCRARLAPHKTPARWFGVTELPLTGSGKVQKFRLREQINGAELKELTSG